VYAGLAILSFFLVIFLQQVAGYGALKSGLTTLPVTLVMFALSRRLPLLERQLGELRRHGFHARSSYSG
jgi:hypothetical protein